MDYTVDVKQIFRLALGVFLALLLAGCDRTPSKADLLKKAEGVKTKAELEKALGKPSDVEKIGPLEKWTYKASDGGKPEDLIQAFRTSYNPRIAVTVDMIATGTDVKPIEMVVFMRMVRSRNFFEQMKGRGVRTIPDSDLQVVTPDAAHKDRFVLVDAVGVTETKLIETTPLERKRGVSLDKLLHQVALGQVSEDLVSTLASRLARIDHRIAPGDRDKLEAAAGQSLKSIQHSLIAAIDPDRHLAAAQTATGAAEADETAVAAAKAWLTTALVESHRLEVGQGHGPVHHFHAWW